MRTKLPKWSSFYFKGHIIPMCHIYDISTQFFNPTLRHLSNLQNVFFWEHHIRKSQVDFEHWSKVTWDWVVAVALPPIILLLLVPGEVLEEWTSSNAASPCSPPAMEAATPCTGIEEAVGKALDQSGDAENTSRLPQGWGKLAQHGCFCSPGGWKGIEFN